MSDKRRREQQRHQHIASRRPRKAEARKTVKAAHLIYLLLQKYHSPKGGILVNFQHPRICGVELIGTICGGNHD